jgi:hypothetical protein
MIQQICRSATAYRKLLATLKSRSRSLRKFNSNIPGSRCPVLMAIDFTGTLLLCNDHRRSRCLRHYYVRSYHQGQYLYWYEWIFQQAKCATDRAKRSGDTWNRKADRSDSPKTVPLVIDIEKFLRAYQFIPFSAVPVIKDSIHCRNVWITIKFENIKIHIHWLHFVIPWAIYW